MEINKNPENEIIIYEDSERGMLVAIYRSDQSLIKRYWKSNGSQNPSTFISGHPLIHDDEQNSLKIDFTQKQQFLIANLTKFK